MLSFIIFNKVGLSMITVNLEPDSKTPLYQQLYLYIKSEIENGGIRGGEKLPSKRELASHLKISVVTVETAYSQLAAEGYISSKRGSGFFAESIFEKTGSPDIPEAFEKSSAKPAEYKYNFYTNRVDTAYFPFSTWAKLSREVLSEQSEELLNACPPQGIPELRIQIAGYLKNYRGMDVSPEQIFIGAGSEYLDGLIVQLLGRDNAYGVENPGYKKIYKIFSANASRVFPVPMDEKGACAETIANFGINVIHVTPSHHFPLGIVMPASRRQELLNWAYTGGDRYIIEDDYDSEFRYSGKPIPALQSMDKNGRIIYINTFTRSLAPSMRISYMVLPPALCARYTDKLGFYSCTVPVFEQHTLAKFIEYGHFGRHINRMKKLYKHRRDLLTEKITGGKLGGIAEISGCDGGMHLLITVHNGMNQRQLLSSAAAVGVRVYGLSEYYSFPVSDMPDNTVVAGFSGLDDRHITEGVEALEKAWTGE